MISSYVTFSEERNGKILNPLNHAWIESKFALRHLWRLRINDTSLSNLQKKLHFTCGLETFFVVRWWGNGSRELKIAHGAQERCTMKSAHPQTRGEFLRVFSQIACWLSHLSQNAFLSSVWRRNTPFPALPAVGETRNRQIRAGNFGCTAF